MLMFIPDLPCTRFRLRVIFIFPQLPYAQKSRTNMQTEMSGLQTSEDVVNLRDLNYADVVVLVVGGYEEGAPCGVG